MLLKKNKKKKEENSEATQSEMETTQPFGPFFGLTGSAAICKEIVVGYKKDENLTKKQMLSRLSRQIKRIPLEADERWRSE